MVKQGGEWTDRDWQTALEYVATGSEATSWPSMARSAIGALVSPHARSKNCTSPQQSRARRGQRQHRLPAASEDFRATAGTPVARACRSPSRRARPRVRRRQLPAQGPSADRAAAAAGDEEGRAALDAALGRRRLADSASRNESIVGAVRSFRPRSPASSSRPAQRAGEAIAGRVLRYRVHGFGEGDRGKPRCRGEKAASSSATMRTQHPRSVATAFASAQLIAELTGATLGFLTEAANTVGAHLARARAARRAA